jgi:D-sedoheptulose 7-phosphate isomerase
VSDAHAASHTRNYLTEVSRIASLLDQSAIERMVALLVETRDQGGRVFFLGVGGGAAHAAHAVTDFRKIASIESYAPTDNSSELTARINDDGWETAYANWLRGSRLTARDAVFIFSVGGGNAEHRISMNLIASLNLARQTGARILGVVGRDGGYTARVADACLLIPSVAPESVTAHTEEFQAVILHLIVSHPRLRANPMKWESER